MESVHSIIDRHGVRHALEFINERIWSIYLWRDGVQAGYAYCVPEAPVLRVNDLFICDAMPLPEARWTGIWRRIAGRPTPTYLNRGRGLGSALMDFIVSQAMAREFARVEGDIFAKDFETNPDLPGWYRKRGFTLTWHPPGAQRVAGLVRHL